MSQPKSVIFEENNQRAEEKNQQQIRHTHSHKHRHIELVLDYETWKKIKLVTNSFIPLSNLSSEYRTDERQTL